MSALEVIRQERLEAEPRPLSEAPADPRAYVYLHFKRHADAAAPALEALVRIRGVWYGSARRRPELAMRGEDAESAAVNLPPGTGEADVEAIAVRAIDPPSQAARVRFVRAFCLDDRCYPRASFAVPAVCALSAATTEATVWERPRPPRRDPRRA